MSKKNEVVDVQGLATKMEDHINNELVPFKMYPDVKVKIGDGIINVTTPGWEITKCITNGFFNFSTKKNTGVNGDELEMVLKIGDYLEEIIDMLDK